MDINQCLSRYIIFYDTSNTNICVSSIVILFGFWLFESQLIHVVAITFTALILTESLIVVLTLRTWHGLMIDQHNKIICISYQIALSVDFCLCVEDSTY